MVLIGTLTLYLYTITLMLTTADPVKVRDGARWCGVVRYCAIGYGTMCGVMRCEVLRSLVLGLAGKIL